MAILLRLSVLCLALFWGAGMASATTISDRLVVTIDGATVLDLSSTEGISQENLFGTTHNPDVPAGFYPLYLLEPGTNLVSDRLIASVSTTQIDFDFESDPLSLPPFCPFGFPCIVESGTADMPPDVTHDLFPNYSSTGRVSVFAFSDFEVPEPGELLLLAAGLGVLAARRARCFSRRSSTD